MKHVHFMGIGGSGISAIGRILLERGYQVSGCDRADSTLLRELAQMGVVVFIGHTSAHLQGVDLVIRSSAIPDDNPEVLAARAAGVPVLKRADFLGELTGGKSTIAVAGSHGKTTTTAMIAWVLTQLGADPSYVIGGISKNLAGNAHAGSGDAFVIEADEYDYMFLGLTPKAIVLTNVEYDHPDCFLTPSDFQGAFEKLVMRLEPGGKLFYCAEDAGARAVCKVLPEGCRSFSYGFQDDCDYQANELSLNLMGGYTFQVWCRKENNLRFRKTDVTLQIAGKYSVLNALATLAIVDSKGLPVSRAAQALSEFAGTGRRFEIVGEVQSVTLVDDYAHHPTQIKSVLEAAGVRFPGRRIWAVWQPHTYSRTKCLMDDFADAFAEADKVIVTDIYAAREKNEGFSAAQVVQEMTHPAAIYVPGLDETADYLLREIRSGDVVFVFSAGDADKINARLLAELGESEKKHG